uniref:Uncharacterized protein n=1 Tax=Timema poppense TaxID=170557 RepID=A0A7R9DW87_TIMPO|nr:unnamed protein product [Timema poppensis]
MFFGVFSCQHSRDSGALHSLLVLMEVGANSSHRWKLLKLGGGIYQLSGDERDRWWAPGSRFLNYPLHQFTCVSTLGEHNYDGLEELEKYICSPDIAHCTSLRAYLRSENMTMMD